MALAEGQLTSALTRLAPSIQEASRSELAATAAKAWLTLSPEARKGAALIAPTHHLCKAITSHVRQAMLGQGTLGPNGHTLQTLSPARLTAAQKSDPASYAQGQMVLFRSGDKAQGIRPSTYFEVGEQVKPGTLRLANEDGVIDWSPAQAKGVEAFNRETLSIAQGDKLRWTRNDPDGRFVNSEFAEVRALNKDHVHLQSETGERHRLRLDDPALKHVGHGWANTLHAMQGRTVDRAIITMESRHMHLTTQKAFYVAVSRSREGLDFITDDKEALAETLELNNGRQITALEIASDKQTEKALGHELTSPEVESKLELEYAAPDRSMDMELGE